eukprot:6410695-Lingulodinium_polyedra.AAC.1
MSWGANMQQRKNIFFFISAVGWPLLRWAVGRLCKGTSGPHRDDHPDEKCLSQIGSATQGAISPLRPNRLQLVNDDGDENDGGDDDENDDVYLHALGCCAQRLSPGECMLDAGVKFNSGGLTLFQLGKTEE